MIGCYCRVSTDEQNLERQMEATNEYAAEQFGAELRDIEYFLDKSTGTDTDRGGYLDMMEAVDEGQIEAVVVQETSRLARSLQDLDPTVERVVEAGAELHFVRDSLPPYTGEDDPMARLMLQMLGAFAEWEARVKRMNTREGIAARQREDGYRHGRPPIGFDKENGQLLPNEEYDRIVAVLDMVKKKELSKRAAAKELETSRATIDRALEKPDLYAL